MFTWCFRGQWLCILLRFPSHTADLLGTKIWDQTSSVCRYRSWLTRRSEPADRKEWGESRFNAALLHLTFIVFWIIRISTLAATGSGFSLFPTDQCEAWTCTVISLLFWAKSYCHHAAFRLYAHRLWSSLLPVGSTICRVLLAALKRRHLCF